MISEDELEELWMPYRYELTFDYVGLWELARRVRDVYPELDDQSVRETVLSMTEHALERSEAQIGTWPRGVNGLAEVWREATDAITDRIRREWISLGRDPGPGEIAWLQRPRQQD